MKKYENIIVPTDGSVNSKRALEHAVVIASSLGATITLVYVANIVSVISNFDQIPNASGYVTEQVALDMEDEGKNVLDEFAKAIPQDVKVKSVFEVGSPGPAILSVAKKYNADLIIMPLELCGSAADSQVLENSRRDNETAPKKLRIAEPGMVPPKR